MTLKRAFDIVLSLALLPPASVVILLCAIAIRCDTPGPAVFRQTRVGRHEKLFKCLKLRTMYLDTPDAPSHEIEAAANTRVGRVLRRTKLDELPQLVNILWGEMSFVGPRPCLPSQHDLIALRRSYGLDKLRPGATGVSQVAGVDMSNPSRLAVLDATYLADMSLVRDIKIILATAAGGGRGDRTAPKKS